jgi:hypothetical protein
MNLYEVWYLYYATQAHVNGVIHKALPSAIPTFVKYPLLNKRFSGTPNI